MPRKDYPAPPSNDPNISVVVWHGPLSALSARLGIPAPLILEQVSRRNHRAEIEVDSPVSLHTLRRQLARPELD